MFVSGGKQFWLDGKTPLASQNVFYCVRKQSSVSSKKTVYYLAYDSHRFTYLSQIVHLFLFLSSAFRAVLQITQTLIIVQDMSVKISPC